MNPKVSIVIPTLNRCDTLAHVLPTLANQTVSRDWFEILLCDTGSTDGTLELVAHLGLSNLRVLAAPGLSRGPARNLGIRGAKADLVLFNDADILASPQLVQRHIEAHARRPGGAIVGCEVRIDSLEEYEAACGNAPRDRADGVQPAGRRRRRTLHPAWRRRLAWFFFLTGNASVGRDALERAGMFDERFTAYGHEDLDLGYRLRRNGVRIRYEPTAVSYHYHPETLDTRLEKMEASGRATVRMYRKHHDRRILWRMGINPATWAMHSLLGGRPALGRWRQRAQSSALARTVALQLAYVSGAKAEWRRAGQLP